MIYNGDNIQVSLADGIAELCFNAKAASINKLDQKTHQEFKEAVSALANAADVKGVLVTSAKSVFIAGADIVEFTDYFKQTESQLTSWLLDINETFNRFEDLPFPKVAAINGAALGGGCEIALICEYRVISQKAQIGFPETGLGIFPGFGGSVRAPRLIGVDNALELIASGTPKQPKEALTLGLVDAAVSPEHLLESAKQLLQDCIEGKFDWQARQAEKKAPIKLNKTEQLMAFNSAKAVIFAKANPKQYPAVALAVETVEAHANLERDEALKIEAQNFARAAKTPQAAALVGLFLNDQLIKKLAKNHAEGGRDIKLSAVLGAGIMGGGIAYQSAVKGVPIIMKDIGNPQLELGMSEVNELLTKQVNRGKLTAAELGQTLARIRPTLSYDELLGVDIVIEAVTENPAIKQQVLADVERKVGDNTIIASNTSTISISHLANSLERPENFVGMHFFNPVHKMPLVEVIRGEQTSDIAIATTVAFAQKMGKKPIVVNDCPGFLVNRVLFPYFGAFDLLIKDGADFVHIDKVMEGFGMPMGPAYLMDVVGMDTGVHAADMMAQGFPDRMKPDYKGAVKAMYEAGRLGQKNGQGFYVYTTDKKGRLVKQQDEQAYDIIKTVQQSEREFDDQQIIDRMILALGNETIRCLEEGIVSTAGEADMALVLGIGFPAFRGGVLRHIDQLGLDTYVALCKTYQHLGKAYEAPDLLLEMAQANQTFYK